MGGAAAAQPESSKVWGDDDGDGDGFGVLFGLEGVVGRCGVVRCGCTTVRCG